MVLWYYLSGEDEQMEKKLKGGVVHLGLHRKMVIKPVYTPWAIKKEPT